VSLYGHNRNSFCLLPVPLSVCRSVYVCLSVYLSVCLGSYRLTSADKRTRRITTIIQCRVASLRGAVDSSSSWIVIPPKGFYIGISCMRQRDISHCSRCNNARLRPYRCGNDFSDAGAKIGEKQSRESKSKFYFLQYVFFRKRCTVGSRAKPPEGGEFSRILVLK